MKTGRIVSVLVLVIVLVAEVNGEFVTCTNRSSRCFLRQLKCPSQCPSTSPSNPSAKVCYLNCNSPVCSPECKSKLMFATVLSLIVMHLIRSGTMN